MTISQTKKRDLSSGLHPSKEKTVIQQVCQSGMKCANVTPNMPDIPTDENGVYRIAGVVVEASVDVFIEDVVKAASVQSMTQRKAYRRSDAIDDEVVSYVVAG
jgi:hypothetical protein